MRLPSRPRHRGRRLKDRPQPITFMSSFLNLTPVGDAEKRSADGRGPGPMFEAHVLCGPSLGPGPLARASQGSRAATVTFGSPFLGSVFDRRKSPEGMAKQKKELAPRRGVKPQDQEKGNACAAKD